MNAIVEAPQRQLVADAGRMSTADVLRHVTAVQEVMKAVMKPEVHYGKIPGTPKPTLFKQGAEVLCLAFKIADEYRTEDLSSDDVARYRVTCIGVHQPTGMVLGQGMGECSSAEEKYKWRKAVCDQEFDATPANLRRLKWVKPYGKDAFSIKQVRTESADAANTALKMANKRAKIAMVLNVLAVSDMFAQDLEDLDAALREQMVDAGGSSEPPPPAEPAVWPADLFAAQFPRYEKAVQAGLKTIDDILTLARSKGALTPEQEAQITGIKVPTKAEDTPPADAGRPDPEFVGAMEAAENAQGGAQ